ncbi:MAG: phage tail tape measure protein [Oscillospiraceae bacterium]|nr:phage tail tape measure protein [Oscillospiraceae bacterium]
MSDGSIRINVELDSGPFKQEIKQMESAGKSGMQRLRDGIDKNISAVEQLEGRKKELTDEIEQQREAQERLARAISETGDETGAFAREQKEVANRISELEGELHDVNQQLAGHQKNLAEVTGKWTAFRTKLDDVGQSMEATGKKLQEVGQGMADIGKNLSKKVTAPLVALGTAAVVAFTSFDDSMRQVKANTGATAEEMDNLRAKALEMGRTTQFSAGQTANAFSLMAQAGWNTGQMLDSVEDIMAAAAATGEQLSTVVGITKDGLTMFGMESYQAGQFVDTLVATAANANTNIRYLGESLKYAGPIAGTTGSSIEDVSLALAMMAENGLRGSMAGTSLANAMQGLINPGTEAAAALDRLDISGTNADGSIRPLNDIMIDLRAATADLTEEQRLNYLTMIGGQQGFRALSAIVNTSEYDFGRLSYAINNSTGLAQEMAETMEGGLGGAFRNLKASAATALVILGDALAPAIQRVAEVAADLVERFMAFAEANPELMQTAVAIAAVAAAVGPLLFVMGKLTKGLGSVMVAGGRAAQAIAGTGTAAGAAAPKVGLLAGAFTALKKPKAHLVIGVGVLVAAFRLLENTSNPLYIALISLAAGFTALKAVKVLTPMILKLKGAFAGLKVATTGMTGLMAIFKDGLVALKAKVIAAKVAIIAKTVAMLANPIGLAVAGVAALAAGLVGLAMWFNRTSDETARLREETDALIGRANELIESTQAGADAFKDNNRELQVNRKATQQLASEILSLSNVQSRSAEQNAHLRTQIDRLNSSVPGLALAMGDYANGLNMSTAALQNYLNAAANRAELDMKMDESNRLRREAIGLELEQADIARQRDELLRRIAAGEYDRNADRNAMLAQAWLLNDAYEDLNDALASNAYQMETLEPLMASANEELAKAESAYYAAAEAAREYEAALWGVLPVPKVTQ